MVLGIIGMGFARRYASTIWPVSSIIGDALVVLATTIWALLMIVFIARAIRFPWSVRQGDASSGGQQFCQPDPGDNAIGVDRFCWLVSPVVAGVICCGGYAAALLCGPGRAPGCGGVNIRERRRRPVLYLPTVANNFISAMACGALGFNDAGLAFLGAGVFSRLSTEPVILQRLRSNGELPAALRTSLGIQLAPALVACSAWLCVNGGDGDTFAKNAIWLWAVAVAIYAAPDAVVSAAAV